MRLVPVVVLLCCSSLAAQEPILTTEHLSPYGLAKPVLFVSGELPKGFENKNETPVLNPQQDAPPSGFQFLTSENQQPESGKVGVHVPPEAIFQIQKRVMANVGKGVVTLRLAKSANRDARSVELEGKKVADYNELRRCAMDRATGSVYPPKVVNVPNVPNGTLVIIGGGGMTPDIGKRFIEAGGGENGHFVSLPISMPDMTRNRSGTAMSFTTVRFGFLFCAMPSSGNELD